MSETPKVDALELLLETFTVEQLRQMAVAAVTARINSTDGRMQDMLIRFKDGKPRWVGVMIWDGLEKP